MDSPWEDTAARFVPRNIRDAFHLCEFLYLAHPTYRKGSERVVDYFITDPKLGSGSDDEKARVKKLLRDDIKTHSVLRNAGTNFMCFHRDTKVVLRDGVYPIGDLAGQRRDVLSRDGIYRPADFKSFGIQRLMEVEFSDGRKVLATPEHVWEVRSSSGKGGPMEVTTANLKPKSHCIERTVAPRPPKDEDYFEGVRHGFVFGDGTKSGNKTPSTIACFCGPELAAMMPFFEGHGSPTKPRVSPPSECPILTKTGLPGHFKDLPDNSASASYWYGFVSGSLVACGTVDTYGCSMLTQVSRATLEAIEAQLPRIGMVAGPHAVYDSTIHSVTLLRQFMVIEDILIPSHRKKFLAGCKSESNYGKRIGIKAVRETELCEEVFCCTEMETHRFVIGNGILTSNCYGNAILGIHLPFKRVLRCKQCGSEVEISALKKGSYRYNLQTGHFHRRCSKESCSCTEHHAHDYAHRDASKIRVFAYDPKRITVKHNPWTDEAEYWFSIPEYVKRAVRECDPFFLRTLPIHFLEASRRNLKLKLDPDYIYHLKDHCPAGIDLRGWGPPAILSSFRNFFRLQILYRHDEKLITDFISPMRFISPKLSGSSNAIEFASTQNFVANMSSMIRKHRIDGAGWNIMPFAADYQVFGGEGRELSPKELIDFEEDRILNARGVPPEFFRASLTIQAAPVALRLFERSWTTLVQGYEDIIRWVVSTISGHLNMPALDVTMESVTIIDDLESKAWKLQALAAQLLSKDTVFSPMQIDSREEFRKILDEQEFEDEESRKKQEKIEMSQLSLDASSQEGGQQGQGGQGGQGGTSLDQIQSEAEQTARTLLGPNISDLQRNQELDKIRKTNPTLHAVVIQKMEQLRGQAAAQGKEQLLPQIAASAPAPLPQ